MIGRVVDTNGDRFQVGDQVLCVPNRQQGLSERFRVTEQQAILVDPRPAVDRALLAQPLGTVLFALRKLPNLIDENVVVVGQGPMGQLFNIALRQLGARQIIAVDQIADRLEVSPRTGATHTVNSSQQDPVKAVEDITQGEGARFVVEAVGHREQVLNLCAEICKPFGTVLFFGVPPKSIDNFSIYTVFWKNLFHRDQRGTRLQQGLSPGDAVGRRTASRCFPTDHAPHALDGHPGGLSICSASDRTAR